MFYSTVKIDDGEVIHFSVVSASMVGAVRALDCYLKGRYEGSGKGGEIISISATKTRGISYRGL